MALLLAWLVPRIPRMPVYVAVVGAFALFWILLPNYPLGLANPGTAVRYRTDYVVIDYLAVVLLTDRRVFVRWRAARAGMRAWLPRRPAPA